VILFALPLVALISIAHLVPERAPAWIWYGTLVALAAAILAGIRRSGWSDPAQLVASVLYVVAAIPTLPLLILYAACTTGDCL
jgi:hypothetical protein